MFADACDDRDAEEENVNILLGEKMI